MRNIATCATFLAILFWLHLPIYAVAPTTALYFASSPTSFIEQGKSGFLTPADGYKFQTQQIIFSNGTESDSIQFSVSQSTQLWDIDFSGPNSALPTIGVYTPVQRWHSGTDTLPGLTFEGENRGVTSVGGSFQIFEFSIGSNGFPQQFAADFTEYENNDPDNWIFGSIRYNSDIPITTVPEPSTLTLVALGGIGLFSARRKLTITL